MNKTYLGYLLVAFSRITNHCVSLTTHCQHLVSPHSYTNTLTHTHTQLYSYTHTVTHTNSYPHTQQHPPTHTHRHTNTHTLLSSHCHHHTHCHCHTVTSHCALIRSHHITPLSHMMGWPKQCINLIFCYEIN